jgi:polyvinyl alcohol dehydrogenase (cytochrome)
MKKPLLLAVCLALSGAMRVSAVPPPAPPAPAAGGDEFSTLHDKMDASKSGVDRETLPGAATYHRVCQQCHEGQALKAPARTFIEMMPPEAIYRALTVGVMQQQAASLSDDDKKHVAEYLSGAKFGAPAPPAAPPCAGRAQRFDVAREPTIAGWGFSQGNTHFIPGTVARLSPADIPRLKVKWAFAYPGAVRARSRPTFAYGALYVGSQNGAVYALDARTGCIRWTFSTTAEVRTSVLVPPAQGKVKRAYFGDIVGRVYSVDALTGRELWRQRIDDHPSATVTGSPVFHQGVIYVPVSSLEEGTADPTYACCTFRGSVVAIDAASGKRLWKRYTIDEAPVQTGVTKAGTKIFAPSGAAVWNTPTIDARRGLLYVGTGNNYTGPADARSNSIVALDLKTGQVAWTWQVIAGDAWNVGCMVGLDSCPANSGPDADIGSGIVLGQLSNGGDRLFIGLKSGLTIAVDPVAHDRALWSNRVGRGSIQGGVQFGMAYDGKRLYVPISDMKNSMDSSNLQRDQSAGAPRPGLYALDPDSGSVLWSSAADDACHGRQYCDAGILAAIAVIPGAVFAGHMDGRIRAYDSSTGKVLWQYDTTSEVRALGGATAHGGSIGGGGPVIYDGMVYENSGYGLYFHMPGNLLLAFSVDGR